MLKTTLGQLLVNDALPAELRDYSRVLDKKGTGTLLQEVVARYPDEYKDIVHKLYDIGHASATEGGGYSFGVRHLMIPEKTKKLRENLQREIDGILVSKDSDPEKQKKIIELTQGRTGDIEKTLLEESVASKNPLALQVISGARGKPGNLRSLLAGDMLYEDHRGRIIPIPITRSYSQGLSAPEYYAGSFGTRKGVIDLKNATRDAGFFGKQLNQAAHRLVVSKRDSDEPYATLRGVPMPVDDPDNEGALLAQPTGKYPRNTILTPKIQAELKADGHDRVLVRSPMVGGDPDGGLYSADVGVRERGGLPAPGDNVGMAAAQALAEPVTQSSIGSKHAGGVAGAGGAVSGFKYINQIVQVPKTFAGGASHAQTDGKVGAIFDAPAGGKYAMIGGVRHFISTGLAPRIKAGDAVEAGDVISEGLPNPGEIVAHKGVGEGRRYFVDVMRDLYKASGLKAHRRNIELLSRGLINHVKLTDEMGDYTAGDVVPYDSIEHHYQPRSDSSLIHTRSAAGQYLERPALHYSIGTHIKPSVVKELEHFGVKDVIAHKEPPPFQPVMIRAMENLLHDPDWMTRQLGTNLRKGLLNAAHRGATSDELDTSFVPGLARSKDFGRVGKTQGWDRAKVIKTQLLHPEQPQYSEED